MKKYFYNIKDKIINFTFKRLSHNFYLIIPKKIKI